MTLGSTLIYLNHRKPPCLPNQHLKALCCKQSFFTYSISHISSPNWLRLDLSLFQQQNMARGGEHCPADYSSLCPVCITQVWSDAAFVIIWYKTGKVDWTCGTFIVWIWGLGFYNFLSDLPFFVMMSTNFDWLNRHSLALPSLWDFPPWYGVARIWWQYHKNAAPQAVVKTGADVTYFALWVWHKHYSMLQHTFPCVETFQGLGTGNCQTFAMKKTGRKQIQLE